MHYRTYVVCVWFLGSSNQLVDTGLGPRNGATVAKVAKKLASQNKLYLTTTHFHPEHAAGEPGFPAGTILIRDKVQQHEMDQHGEEMVKLFASRNDRQRELRKTSSCSLPADWVRRSQRTDCQC